MLAVVRGVVKVAFRLPRIPRRAISLQSVGIVFCQRLLQLFDERTIADEERHALVQVFRLEVKDVA